MAFSLSTVKGNSQHRVDPLDSMGTRLLWTKQRSIPKPQVCLCPELGDPCTALFDLAWKRLQAQPLALLVVKHLGEPVEERRGCWHHAMVTGKDREWENPDSSPHHHANLGARILPDTGW